MKSMVKMRWSIHIFIHLSNCIHRAIHTCSTLVHTVLCVHVWQAMGTSRFGRCWVRTYYVPRKLISAYVDICRRRRFATCLYGIHSMKMFHACFIWCDGIYRERESSIPAPNTCAGNNMLWLLAPTVRTGSPRIVVGSQYMYLKLEVMTLFP